MNTIFFNSKPSFANRENTGKTGNTSLYVCGKFQKQGVIAIKTHLKLVNNSTDSSSYFHDYQ